MKIGGISVGTYGPYDGNYGTHCLQLDFGPLTAWFSYRTLVAFQVLGHARVVHENVWGPTTGRHLNAIDNCAKSARVPAAQFEQLYTEQCGTLLAALSLAANSPKLLTLLMERVGENSQGASHG